MVHASFQSLHAAVDRGRRPGRGGRALPRGRTRAVAIGAVLSLLAALPATALAGSTGAAAAPAAAAPAVNDDLPPLAIALIVGVNRSVDPQLPLLHYADDDAVRYDELFRTLGTRTHILMRGDENTRRVAPAAVASAYQPRRGELTRALDRIGAEVAAARAQGRRTVFYFIYAGHGSLTQGQAYLALEDARLDGAEIEHGIIDKVHADQSHLIIDACYSYFLAHGRGPGGSRREVHGFAPVEGLARRSDVGLLLSTTSARESHEWEGFQAGVFSHEVRSGLFGAADFDGDGRISYREIAAFINRANAAIPNERFRPDVFARAPAPDGSGQLLDLRTKPGLRHLVVDGAAQAGRYFLDDTRGVRVADFHNAPGHDVRLLLPANSGRLYLRRTRDDREFEIPTTPDVITLSDLSGREPRSTARGAAHDAFSVIFTLPFDQHAFAQAAVASRPEVGVQDQLPPELARPRWRTIAGLTTAGVAAISVVAATAFTLSARDLAADARRTPWQTEAASLNERVNARNGWARAGYALGGAAAVTSALLLLWPRSNVYGAGGADGDSAMLELGGRF